MFLSPEVNKLYRNFIENNNNYSIKITSNQILIKTQITLM